MADKPEMIDSQIEATRSSLADKLSQLGEKVSGTVETVEGAVETVEQVVENVAETAEQTVESVKETFNLSRHVEQHPWLMVGGAAAVGFVGTKLLESMLSTGRRASPEYPGISALVSSEHETGQAHHNGGHAGHRRRRRAEQAAHRESQSQEGGWISSLTSKLAPDLDTLKGLAMGTLFGVVRDMVSQSLPDNLKSEVTKFFDDMTSHLGGKPIQGSLTGQPSEGEGDQAHAGRPEREQHEWPRDPQTGEVRRY